MGLTSSSTASTMESPHCIKKQQQRPPPSASMSPDLPLRRDFDKLFADMEFRAKRAALMNYHEAEKCDKRADYMLTLSAVVGALGVSGIGASVVKTKKVAASSAGVAGVLALPLSGVLQFLASGSSKLAPTSGDKARLHTKAGAGWQRIARETRAYRVQLKYLTDEEVHSPVLWAWYREIVVANEVVSRTVPIKPDTYLKFDRPETVHERLTKREVLLRMYMDLEPLENDHEQK